MTVAEILEQAKALTPEERNELIEQLVILETEAKAWKNTAEIIAEFEDKLPIELVDSHIVDPVEWMEAQRQKEADRLKPYWDESE